jgi:hypothetical protein
MKYITNINTLSVLLDRLIVENIKLYFFTKDNLSENVIHQNEIINEIKNKISEITCRDFSTGEGMWNPVRKTITLNPSIFKRKIRCKYIIDSNKRS